MSQNKRYCPECGTRIYWAIYCSNVCSDKAYAQWKKDNPQYFDNVKRKRDL